MHSILHLHSNVRPALVNLCALENKGHLITFKFILHFCIHFYIFMHTYYHTLAVHRKNFKLALLQFLPVIHVSKRDSIFTV